MGIDYDKIDDRALALRQWNIPPSRMRSGSIEPLSRGIHRVLTFPRLHNGLQNTQSGW
jgi:hypothetical protein